MAPLPPIMSKTPTSWLTAFGMSTFLENIPQFQEMAKNHSKRRRRNMRFEINSATVNLEVKYVWYQKLFKDEWAIGTVFGGQATSLRRLTAFLNEKYSNLPSLLDLNIDQVEREWLFWLEQQGVLTQQTIQHMTYGELINKTPTATFFTSYPFQISHAD